jgi:DNA (cytosine-5)-methyltransferase 1
VREVLAPAYSVVDLFAGAGGISEGFQQSGFQIIAGLDSDPDAAATYRRNFPGAVTICGDIRKPEVAEQLAEVVRRADVIVGGPPCQAFSQVRNHARMIDDPRNHLYREFVGALRSARPLAFLMENVTGIDQMGVREQIHADLTLDGEYKVKPQVLDAADFGVPQTRKRLLFVGVRGDLGVEPPSIVGTGATGSVTLERTVGPTRSRYKVVVQEMLGAKGIYKALSNPEDESVVTAHDAISDLACLPVGNRDDEMPYSALPGAASAYQRRMRVGAGSVVTNVQVPRINADTALRLRGVPRAATTGTSRMRFLTATSRGSAGGRITARGGCLDGTSMRIGGCTRISGRGHLTPKVIPFTTTNSRVPFPFVSSPAYNRSPIGSSSRRTLAGR